MIKIIVGSRIHVVRITILSEVIRVNQSVTIVHNRLKMAVPATAQQAHEIIEDEALAEEVMTIFLLEAWNTFPNPLATNQPDFVLLGRTDTSTIRPPCLH